MKCEAIRENAYSAFKQHIRNLRKGECLCGEAKRDGKDSSVYIRVLGAFFVFLLLCLSAFFGAVKKSIEQNVRQTITANIDRQSVSFSSDITIQYQYLEGLQAIRSRAVSSARRM